MKPRQRVVIIFCDSLIMSKELTSFFFIIALIENITSVPNYSYATDGTSNVSLLIQTSHRQIKLTAPTMEKHDLWFEVSFIFEYMTNY